MTAPKIGAVKKNPLTVEQVKKENPSELFSYHHHYSSKNKSVALEPVRVKITSIKTWKTRPTEIRIGCKYGMYEYFYITQFDLDQWTLDHTDAKNFLNEVAHK